MTRAQLVMLAATLAACSTSHDEDRVARSSAAISNGADDASHTGVVAIDAMLPGGEELCSGTLITADLVLTARHCVSPLVKGTGSGACGETAGAPIAPSKLSVSNDAVIGAKSKTVDVAEVFVEEGSTGLTLCGNDLALLRLAAPIPGATPIGLRLDVPPSVGEAFTAVGYGVGDPADADSSGSRRSHEASHVVSLGASARTRDGEWIADFGPCAGDSGSPALDTAGLSFGVMSRGDKGACANIIYESVDGHAAFLQEQARASATRLGEAPPAWARPGDAGTNDGGATATPAASTSGCSLGTTRPSDPSPSSWTVGVLVALACMARRKPPMS